MTSPTAQKVASSRADRPSSFNLADIPMPTGKEEDWRFTPLKRIAPLLAEQLPGADPQVLLGGKQPQEITEGSPILIEENSQISLEKSAQIYGKIGAPGDRSAVVAWNNHHRVLSLRIGKNQQLKQPVILQVKADGQAPSAQHICIEAEPGSKGLVILEHQGPGALNQSVEVLVAEDAELELVSIQEWDRDAIHASNHRIALENKAKIKHIVITFGGDLVRICPDLEYRGEGAEAEMLGVYFTDSQQHQEHRLFVDHETRDCKSDVNYRGALQGKKAHAVWIGDVLIGKGAFGTDSYEQNRNLVLNKGAVADSVPNLEIENGDIAGAGHASATGRFDDEQLFYLRSRGIPEAEARKLVVHGFFAELINQIGIEEVQERLLVAVDRELEKAQSDHLFN